MPIFFWNDFWGIQISSLSACWWKFPYSLLCCVLLADNLGPDCFQTFLERYCSDPYTFGSQAFRKHAH